MSIRRLYQTVPVKQRLCTYYRCQRPVLRNIDRTKDGRIWHHGCLMEAQDERYRCLECYYQFDATEASFDVQHKCFNDEFSERLKPMCPSCGSTNLKSLGGLEA